MASSKPSGKLPRLPVRRQTKLGAAGAAGAAGAVGAAALAWYYLKDIAKVPRIYAGEGHLKTLVLPHCTLLHQPYKPTPWAANAHAQTVLGLLRKLTVSGQYTRQLLIMNDGGTIGLDWYQGCDVWEYAPPTTPIHLVLHGINGGSHEGYCRWACATAMKRGWRSVVINYRGCNGLPLTSPRGYAATLTHDVHYAIASIRARFPDAPLFASGYSLGGIILTKYLGEADLGLHGGEGSGLVAAAVVSSPVCLSNSSAQLSQPWTPGYLYNMAVAYKYREFIHEHRDTITLVGLDKALDQWTIQAIEDRGVPQFLGYRNRQEYYETASGLNFIPHIRTPTLLLLSEDDPFLGVIPDVECERNPNTLLALTARGGHVAFLEGMWPLSTSYMDRAVMQFFRAVQQHLPLAAGAARCAAAAASAAATPAAGSGAASGGQGGGSGASGRGMGAGVQPHQVRSKL